MTERGLLVVYIVHEFPARTQTFVEREIRAVQNLGLPVLPYSIHNPRSSVGAARDAGLSRWDYLRAGLVVTLRTISSVAELVWVARLPPTGGRALSRQAFAFLKSLKVAQIARAAEFAGYSVHFHCHFVARTLDVLSLAKILVPSATTSATAHAADASNPASRQRLAVLTGRLDSRVAASNNVAVDLLRTSGHAADAVVHCGVSVPDRAAEGALSTDHLRVLTVARLVEKKGIDICLAAAFRLQEMGIPFTWTIVGDGPLRVELERSGRQLVEDGHLILLGFRNNAEVMNAIEHEVDLVVLPSKPASDGDSDGIPVVLMEAMSYGIPVVSTRVGGIPELIQEGAGWLVEPGDPEAIVEAVAEAASDREEARHRGLNGRCVVTEQFASDSEAYKMVEIFKADSTGRR